MVGMKPTTMSGSGLIWCPGLMLKGSLVMLCIEPRWAAVGVHLESHVFSVRYTWE